MNTLFTGKRAFMNDEERKQFVIMQEDMKHLTQEFASLGIKVDKMFVALMGSEIARDGGLVARIIHLESQCDGLEKGQQEIKAAAGKSQVYIRLMWGAIGFAGSALFTYVLSLIFKK